MSANKRPSTSSLRRFITTRPYVAIAELRRLFGLDDPDAMSLLERNGQVVWIGLPEREATKLQDLWLRDEIGMELSVEVRAPVVVGIYPMRIARYMMDGAPGNGSNGFHSAPVYGTPAAVASAASATSAPGPAASAPGATAPALAE